MKKIFKPALLAVFAVLTAVNVYKAQTDVQLSDAQLKNVEALATGELYASQGPEIKELYLENGIVHVECSDAVKIVLQTDNRLILQERAPEGESINSADFEIDDKNKYFRITVTDAKGKHANTNAYFMDEL